MNKVVYDVNDPRSHPNEEPRDDLFDLMFGFGAMFIGMFGVATIATIVALFVK
ncbi:YqzM family protein [Paenibacillus swuensis]|uniref:YqzM family protein n=1 Tax=Paenibacillus swuensis TaxID=1178515 RepID=UPI000A86A16F|nr:YqzM family protein [Paenibacillus swuensis]